MTIRAGTEFTWGAFHNIAPMTEAGFNSVLPARRQNLKNWLTSTIVGNGDTRYSFRNVSVGATSYNVAVSLTANVDFAEASHVHGLIRQAAEQSGFNVRQVTTAYPGGSTVPVPNMNPTPYPNLNLSTGVNYPNSNPRDWVGGQPGQPDGDNTMLWIIGGAALIVFVMMISR